MHGLPDARPETVREALRAVEAYIAEQVARVHAAAHDERSHLRGTLTAAARRDLADARRHRSMIAERLADVTGAH